MTKKRHAIRLLTFTFLTLMIAGALLLLSLDTYAGASRKEDSALVQAATAALATSPGPSASGAAADIVARVNGEPVARGELQRMLADPLARGQFERELGVQERNDATLERLAFRMVINRRLVLQEAARRNYAVSEQDLDKAITALRRRFGDLRSFGAWMKEQGLDDNSLFEAIRTDLLADRVKAALVEGVRVPDEQVRQYYEAHKEDLKTEEVWIQIIAVKDRATAEEIQAALKEGEDFGHLARQRSIGLRAAQGGDVGWVNAETLWPPLREAIGALKPGEAIGPLQKGEELLIVRLQERRPGGPKSLAEARPEIERRLLPGMQQEILRSWLTEQERNSNIEVFP